MARECDGCLYQTCRMLGLILSHSRGTEGWAKLVSLLRFESSDGT